LQSLEHDHLSVLEDTLRQTASSLERVAFAVFSLAVVSAHRAAEQLAKVNIPSIGGPLFAYLAPNPHFINVSDLRGNKDTSVGQLFSHDHPSVQHETLRQTASSGEHVAVAVFNRAVDSAQPAADQLTKERIPSIGRPHLAYLAPSPHFINLGDWRVNPVGTGIVSGQNGDTGIRLVGTTGRARFLLSGQDNLMELIAFLARHDTAEREVNDHVDSEPLSFDAAVNIGGGRPRQSRSVLDRRRAPWHALRAQDFDYDALARFS
jgi:hypothetical protein